MISVIERYHAWRFRYKSKRPTDAEPAETNAEPKAALSPRANSALALEEFAAGVTTVQSTPTIITLESTSRCNLRCVMCPHAIGEVHRPKHLDETLVGRVKSFLKRASEVQLHGIGEPTNSPAFWRLLRELPPPEVCASSVNSNLTMMDEKRIDQILNSNLKIINVSLDAGTAETYQKIRGFSFEVVTGNIERLIKSRRERRQIYPMVLMNMTLMRSNIEELGDFIRLAERLGADAIHLWHLNHLADDEMARYVVERDGWTFDYAREGLWNYPSLSNRCIRDAVELAREKCIALALARNTEVYFDCNEPA
jgi:MoaA/NifB/PqqE/SkfB family radical SAM enzyme